MIYQRKKYFVVEQLVRIIILLLLVPVIKCNYYFLVHFRYVLSSAHCFVSRVAGGIAIVVGEHDINTGVQLITILDKCLFDQMIYCN